MPLPEEKEVFTYGMYKTWPDDERWEIIDGIPYNMSPAPNTEHQRLSITISNELYNFLKDKECKVFAAPFDVRLPEKDEADNDITTVVQPEIK